MDPDRGKFHPNRWTAERLIRVPHGGLERFIYQIDPLMPWVLHWIRVEDPPSSLIMDPGQI